LLTFGADSVVFKFAIQNLTINILIIVPVVLYGCETWSLTLREERRLRVFENRVLRRIFGSKRDEVRGEWKKLHNEELNYLYCSPNVFGVTKSRRMGWAGHVTRMGEKRAVYRVLVGRSEGNRPIEDLRVDEKIILTYSFSKWLWRHGLDRCGSGYRQVAGTCECGKELSGSIKCGTFLR